MAYQLFGQGGEGGFAHEHAGRRTGIGERGDIEVSWQFSIDVVAGHHLHPARDQPFGQRRAEIGRRSGRGGDAGHDLDRNAGLARRAEISSSARAKIEGSPDLTRTTRLPSRA